MKTIIYFFRPGVFDPQEIEGMSEERIEQMFVEGNKTADAFKMSAEDFQKEINTGGLYDINDYFIRIIEK